MGVTGVVLPEWGQAVSVYSLTPRPANSPCFVLAFEEVSSQLPVPAITCYLFLCLTANGLFSLWNHDSKPTLSSSSCLTHMFTMNKLMNFPLYHYLTTLLVLMSDFIYSAFLLMQTWSCTPLVTICTDHLCPPLHFHPVCVFVAKGWLSQAAYCGTLFDCSAKISLTHSMSSIR